MGLVVSPDRLAIQDPTHELDGACWDDGRQKASATRRFTMRVKVPVVKKDESERHQTVSTSNLIEELLDEIETEQTEVKRQNIVKPRSVSWEKRVPYTHD
jgi:hypothetical protein